MAAVRDCSPPQQLPAESGMRENPDDRAAVVDDRYGEGRTDHQPLGALKAVDEDVALQVVISDVAGIVPHQTAHHEKDYGCCDVDSDTEFGWRGTHRCDLSTSGESRSPKWQTNKPMSISFLHFLKLKSIVNLCLKYIT